MSLGEKIKYDLKNAMAAGDKFKVRVLRVLLSDLEYVKKTMKPLESFENDKVVLEVLSSYHSRLLNSLRSFSDDFKAKQVEKEIKIVHEYLSPDHSDLSMKTSILTEILTK